MERNGYFPAEYKTFLKLQLDFYTSSTGSFVNLDLQRAAASLPRWFRAGLGLYPLWVIR